MCKLGVAPDDNGIFWGFCTPSPRSAVINCVQRASSWGKSRSSSSVLQAGCAAQRVVPQKQKPVAIANTRNEDRGIAGRERIDFLHT